jgi:arginyl-tRNA synthetase
VRVLQSWFNRRRINSLQTRTGKSACATENDPAKKKFLLQLSRLVEIQLVAALELLGIESPEKM